MTAMKLTDQMLHALRGCIGLRLEDIQFDDFLAEQSTAFYSLNIGLEGTTLVIRNELKPINILDSVEDCGCLCVDRHEGSLPFEANLADGVRKLRIGEKIKEIKVVTDRVSLIENNEIVQVIEFDSAIVFELEGHSVAIERAWIYSETLIINLDGHALRDAMNDWQPEEYGYEVSIERSEIKLSSEPLIKEQRP